MLASIIQDNDSMIEILRVLVLLCGVLIFAFIKFISLVIKSNKFKKLEKETIEMKRIMKWIEQNR